METSKIITLWLFLGLVFGALADGIAEAAPAPEYEETLLVSCAPGYGGGEYVYHLGGGYPVPILPRCFAVAPDGTLWVAQGDAFDAVRLLAFDASGEHRASFLLRGKSSVVQHMAIDGQGRICFTDHGWVFAFDPKTLTLLRAGPDGLVRGDTLQDVTAERGRYGSTTDIELGDSGYLHIIENSWDIAARRLHIFDWEAGSFVSRDLPVPSEYESRRKMSLRVGGILRERGVKHLLDVQIGPKGAFYYMTVAKEKLEIHKLLFADDGPLIEEEQAPTDATEVQKR